MSALDKLLSSTSSHWPTLTPKARTELAALRAQVADQARQLIEARDCIAWLTSDIGESGLAAINHLIAACERGDIPQQYAPDLSITRDEILRNAPELQAAQQRGAALEAAVNEARKIIHDRCYGDTAHQRESYDTGIAWLAAHPAPAPRCTCGMGDATEPEYHATDCALNATQAEQA